MLIPNNVIDALVAGALRKNESQVFFYVLLNADRNGGWTQPFSIAQIGRKANMSGPDAGRALARLETANIIHRRSERAGWAWCVNLDTADWQLSDLRANTVRRDAG
jgi:hypothetical protein